MKKLPTTVDSCKHCPYTTEVYVMTEARPNPHTESRLKLYTNSKEYHEAYLISCGDFSKYYSKFWTLKHFIKDLEDLE